MALGRRDRPLHRAGRGRGGGRAAESALPEGAPEFEPEERFYVAVPPPAGAATGEGPEAFGDSIQETLENDIETDDGKLPYALALYIPENYGEPGAVAPEAEVDPILQVLLVQIVALTRAVAPG